MSPSAALFEPIRPAPWNPGAAFRLVLVHAVVVGGAVVMLLPFAWMLLTSIWPPAPLSPPRHHYVSHLLATAASSR